MEKAIFYIDNLNITQKENNSYSHKGDLALDITKTNDLGAPFTGIIKRIYTPANAVWLESLDKVKYADGTIDYMTVLTMHDSDISNLKVGMKINQGQKYYNEGTRGNVTGKHMHIAVGKGKFQNNGWYENNFGNWVIYNQYSVYKSLYLTDSCTIENGEGYNWNRTSTTVNETTKYQINDKCIFTGYLYVDSVGSKRGAYRNNLECTISKIVSGAPKPYLINNTLGWVAEEDLKSITNIIKYTVKSGDNLTKIAKKYNTTWQKIYNDNKDIIGTNPNLLKIGQILTINF